MRTLELLRQHLLGRPFAQEVTLPSSSVLDDESALAAVKMEVVTLKSGRWPFRGRPAQTGVHASKPISLSNHASSAPR